MALMRFALLSLVILLGNPGASAASVNWPPLPSRLKLETPFGTLGIHTSEYVYESRLHIDDIDIDPPIKGLLNITYAFSLPKSQIALISVSDGNNDCPVSYRWVVLEKDGYKVSPAFGSCSTQVKVSVRSGAFKLETPNSKKPDKIDVYVYDGKTIKTHTKP